MPKEKGFSIIESLFSLLLLLTISLGIVPLMMRSMKDNDSGARHLESTNITKTVLEEFRELAFDSPRLTVPTTGNELVTQEYYSIADETWKTGTPPADDPAEWRRTVTVRQFNNSDFADNGRLDTPLSGSVTTDFVHIKEIEVAIESENSSGPLGQRRRLTVKHLKSF